jgi:hypothetical protein
MPIKILEGMHSLQMAIGITPLALEIYFGLKHPETNEAIKHVCLGLLESSLAFTVAVMLEEPIHKIKDYLHNFFYK